MSKQLITPELANEWVTSYRYEKDLMHSVMRNIRPRHVEYLAAEMKRGAFGSATISFADCKESGRRFIVNGNHTLQAIIKSGQTLYLTVEYNECDTMDQVRHLYATYDKNLLRQRADSLRAYDAHNVLNIRQDDVKRLSAAVGYIMTNFGASRQYRISDADLLVEMEKWTEPYGRLLVAVGTSKPWYYRVLGRRAVLAVALISMKHQPKIAYPFWESVATGAGLKLHAPALRLRDYLTDLVVSKDGEMVSTEDVAKAVAYCWNKHYNGERIVQMKVSYDKPLEIAGAPKSITTRTIQEPVTPVTVGEMVPA